MRLMIKTFSVLCLILSLLTPNLALSHSNHGAPLNDEQAIDKAIEYTGRIVEEPDAVEGISLDDSWQSVTEAKIHKKNLRYFIVSLHNANQQKTLYLLINSFGELHGANFDGMFEEL